MKIILKADNWEEIRELLKNIPVPSILVPIKKTPIDNLDIPTRERNAWKKAGINYIEQLLSLMNGEEIKIEWSSGYGDERKYYSRMCNSLLEVSNCAKNIGKKSILNVELAVKEFINKYE